MVVTRTEGVGGLLALGSSDELVESSTPNCELTFSASVAVGIDPTVSSDPISPFFSDTSTAPAATAAITAAMAITTATPPNAPAVPAALVPVTPVATSFVALLAALIAISFKTSALVASG